MSFKRKLIATLVIVSGGVVALNIFLSRMHETVLSEASRIADGAAFCWVDGQFIQGDVPTTRLVAQGRAPFQPWEDVKNALLHREQAKPVHFGFVVPEADGDSGAFWAWSYRDRRYWQDADLSTLTLLGGTQIIAACRGR